VADETKWYVCSLPTREHLEQAYVGLGTKVPGPTNWYITTNRAEVHAFDHHDEAKAMVDELKGKITGDDRTYYFVDPQPQRLWHATSSIGL
jgi:hypothetical protein